jgi:Tfp pilus assembly protein FimT
MGRRLPLPVTHGNKPGLAFVSKHRIPANFQDIRSGIVVAHGGARRSCEAVAKFGIELGLEVEKVKTRNARFAGEKPGWHDEKGRSMIETLIVVAIIALLTSVAVPQMIAARRLMRSAALPREVATQLRYTRQQAMSQAQAFTFQYDNSNKTIKIFDHNNFNNATAACNMPGKNVLSQPGFPNTACTITVLTIPLATGAGLPASEVSYGIPSGIGASTLDDGNTMTSLSGTVVNITFLSDGTSIDAAGNYARPTLFFYNNLVPTETASAVSVLGAAGRIKVWRYNTSVSKYAE